MTVAVQTESKGFEAQAGILAKAWQVTVPKSGVTPF
jgi:hypothetical protein